MPIAFRQATTAAPPAQLGPAPPPFDIPSLLDASSGSGSGAQADGSVSGGRGSSTSDGSIQMNSPPPSSTKKKNGAKRSKLHSPLGPRSPFGFLSPNGAAAGDGVGGGAATSLSSSLSLGSGSARKLFMSPTERRKKKKKRRSKQPKTTAAGPAGSTLSPSLGVGVGSGQQFQIYSPSPPTKQQWSASVASGGAGVAASGLVRRASISANKVKDSLRKDRKRQKGGEAASGASAGIGTGTTAAFDELGGDDAPAEPQEELQGEEQPPAAAAAAAAAAEEEGAETEEAAAIVEFTYPTDSVAIPGPKVVKYFHGLATAGKLTNSNANALTTARTHQSQLDALGTALLSLEDVVIPAAAHEENAALKLIQSKLQRQPEANAASIQICVAVRAYVLDLASLGATAARTNRLMREEEFRQELRRRNEAAKAERRRVREEARAEREKRKEELRCHRQREKERARIKAKKNHPRNKELWREVANLMKDVAKLQKEERMWDQASIRLDERERDIESRLQQLRDAAAAAAPNDTHDDSQLEGEDASIVAQGREVANNAERSTANAIDDIMTSAGRVDATLRDVADLIEKSDAVRRDLYGKYRSDHQFHGYRGNKDTKGLIVALSQG